MRLIATIVMLVFVAVLVGILTHQQLAPAEGLLRWLMVTSISIFAMVIAFTSSIIRYRIPKADVAVIRTGGQSTKIGITSGIWVNTIFHEIMEISLNTMRFEIIREGPESLTTRDLSQVDIEAAFYIKVEPIEDDILIAAQTLGYKMITPDTIREWIEPKLEGALRSVAGESEFIDLLQKRQEFADKVQETVGNSLKFQNGLTLETVSIINVCQTPLQILDPQSRFDAIEELRCNVHSIKSIISGAIDDFRIEQDELDKVERQKECESILKCLDSIEGYLRRLEEILKNREGQ